MSLATLGSFPLLNTNNSLIILKKDQFIYKWRIHNYMVSHNSPLEITFRTCSSKSFSIFKRLSFLFLYTGSKFIDSVVSIFKVFYLAFRLVKGRLELSCYSSDFSSRLEREYRSHNYFIGSLFFFLKKLLE